MIKINTLLVDKYKVGLITEKKLLQEIYKQNNVQFLNGKLDKLIINFIKGVDYYGKKIH